MTRRLSLIRSGATEMYILALDLELFSSIEEAQFKHFVNAYSVAVANNLPNLQWYRYR